MKNEIPKPFCRVHLILVFFDFLIHLHDHYLWLTENTKDQFQADELI